LADAVAEMRSAIRGEVRSASASRSDLVHIEEENLTMRRSSSRRSVRSKSTEFIYPDTIQQRVTAEDCPVCQIMLPKGRFGSVCPRAPPLFS
jgi:hypothetical protein